MRDKELPCVISAAVPKVALLVPWIDSEQGSRQRFGKPPEICVAVDINIVPDRNKFMVSIGTTEHAADAHVHYVTGHGVRSGQDHDAVKIMISWCAVGGIPVPAIQP